MENGVFCIWIFHFRIVDTQSTMKRKEKNDAFNIKTFSSGGGGLNYEILQFCNTFYFNKLQFMNQKREEVKVYIFWKLSSRPIQKLIMSGTKDYYFAMHTTKEYSLKTNVSFHLEVEKAENSST